MSFPENLSFPCRLTTYRHRFARVTPAPRAKRKIQRIVDAHRPLTKDIGLSSYTYTEIMIIVLGPCQGFITVLIGQVLVKDVYTDTGAYCWHTKTRA